MTKEENKKRLEVLEGKDKLTFSEKMELSKLKKVDESGDDGDGKVENESEFRAYAKKVLRKTFGDKFDDKKAGETINGLVKKYGGDNKWGDAIGALTNGLDESKVDDEDETDDELVTESKDFLSISFVEDGLPDIVDGKSKDAKEILSYLKKNGIKMKSKKEDYGYNIEFYSNKNKLTKFFEFLEKYDDEGELIDVDDFMFNESIEVVNEGEYFVDEAKIEISAEEQKIMDDIEKAIKKHFPKSYIKLSKVNMIGDIMLRVDFGLIGSDSDLPHNIRLNDPLNHSILIDISAGLDNISLLESPKWVFRQKSEEGQFLGKKMRFTIQKFKGSTPQLLVKYMEKVFGKLYDFVSKNKDIIDKIDKKYHKYIK